ncbi:MAG: phosphoglucosamine mutase [Planctomycetota bacterium]|jgi:phosphoglucosamine mutase
MSNQSKTSDTNSGSGVSTMAQERIFGTDGIRGRAFDGWLTTDAVSALGRALGRLLKQTDPNAKHLTLIGHDGRRSGPALETALASGLTQMDVESVSAGLIPTPGLAWLTRDKDFTLGAMISASHNPSQDNGIKLFSASGGKLDDETELELEALLREELAQPSIPGRSPRLNGELELEYLAHLIETAGAGLDLSGWPIVIDCANGAGSRVAPRALGRLGAQTHPIAAEPDGDNINQNCGSTHPEGLRETVRARKASIGIALDGDGDRCILVDENGEVVHGDGIMTMLGRHAAQMGRMKDPRIVATVMSNRGLNRALREVGVEVIEVGVGDRAVVERLRSEGLELGGEQSGHIVLGEANAFIGDGTYTALAVLQVMAESGKPLSELAAPFQPLPQILLNVPVRSKPNLRELPDVLELVQQTEDELAPDGRVLLRYSGTEDLARVMVEGLDPERIGVLARQIAHSIQRQIGTETS